VADSSQRSGHEPHCYGNLLAADVSQASSRGASSTDLKTTRFPSRRTNVDKIADLARDLIGGVYIGRDDAFV
jgi:hypothetical protein